MLETPGNSISPLHIKRRPLYNVYREMLIAVMRSPAAWLFGLVWVSAVIILLLSQHSIYVHVAFAILGLVLVCMLLILPLTRDAPSVVEKRPTTRSTLGLQVVLLSVVIVLTALFGMILNGLLPLLIRLPPWFPYMLLVLNPLFYCIIPLVLLYFTGARGHELGMDSAWHAWRVVVLCVVIRLLFGVFGQLSLFYATPFVLVPLLRSIVFNALENGFFEEFFFVGRS